MRVTKSPAAPESREHRHCIRERLLPSSPVQLPSAEGKSIRALTQHWSDQKKKGSAASASMDGCPMPPLQIRGLAEWKGI